MKEKLPIMFSAGQTLMLGGLVASSFAGPPAVLGMAMTGVGGILLASLMLAIWSAGRSGSAGELLMFPDHRLSMMLPGAAVMSYLGVLATVGGTIVWSAKQVGLVGLLVFFVAYFLVGLYLTFRASEPFVSRDTLDGNPRQ